jgi:hypothetical protein
MFEQITANLKALGFRPLKLHDSQGRGDRRTDLVRMSKVVDRIADSSLIVAV